MGKLVQHIKMDMSGFPKQGLYCYCESSFEANQAMQEPLEKLYKYENQPDMREKVKEYIDEIDVELNRCRSWLNDNREKLGSVSFERMYGRINALMEVKNDLQSRLEEFV